jgi:transcriptional regulator with XRE-family HTH domain
MEVTPQGATGHHYWWEHTGIADPDRVLPGQLRALREAAGYTQRLIADQMTLAGYKMHQTTVAKIEAGERPVTVGEAAALAHIVGASLADLITPPDTDTPAKLAEALAQRSRLQREARECRATAAVATQRLHEVQRALADAEKRVGSLIRVKGPRGSGK